MAIPLEVRNAIGERNYAYREDVMGGLVTACEREIQKGKGGSSLENI